MKECECSRLKNELIQLKFEKRQVEIESAELKRKIRNLESEWRGKDANVSSN